MHADHPAEDVLIVGVEQRLETGELDLVEIPQMGFGKSAHHDIAFLGAPPQAPEQQLPPLRLKPI